MKTLSVLCLILIGCFLVGCSFSTRKEHASSKTTAAPTSRKAFESIVIGKSEDEVLKTIGRPFCTSGNGSSWYYTNVTIDPISQQADKQTILHVSGGRVVSVSY